MSGQEGKELPGAQSVSESHGGRGEFPEKGQPYLILQKH